MSDEITALKEKIDRDMMFQHGPSTIDVDRLLKFYERHLQEANNALITFDGELLALEIMKLPDADLQAAIKHDRVVIDERHSGAIERAKASMVVDPEPVKIDEPIPSGPHEKHVQGDELFCPKCGKRWDLDEDEPVCESSNSGIG